MQLYERELGVARALAREAGDIIMRHYEAGDVDVTTKPDQSPVTAADLEANVAIVAGLRAAFPEDGILSEESPDDGGRLSRPRVWIIDPLDGTRDFIARTGEFCVHIALADRGQPVVGAVYQASADALYFASRGGGAFLEQGGTTRRLEGSHREVTSEVRVGIGRFKLDPGLEQCMAASGLIPRSVRMGASVKHMAVARGDLDAVLNLSTSESEWDTCAPEVVLREAGCLMTDGDGQDFHYNQESYLHRRGSISSNGRCHPLMLRVMAPCLPE